MNLLKPALYLFSGLLAASYLPTPPIHLAPPRLACHGKGQCDLPIPDSRAQTTTQNAIAVIDTKIISAWIPEHPGAHVEFSCLVEHSGSFRRILHIQEARFFSKGQEFYGQVDYVLSDPNQIHYRLNGHLSKERKTSVFSANSKWTESYRNEHSKTSTIGKQSSAYFNKGSKPTNFDTISQDGDLHF